MALVDLIATGKEAEQLVAQRDSLTQQVADLQNQIDTANLQHQNDAESIALLNAGLTADTKTIAELQAHIVSDEALLRDDVDQITKLSAQLAQLNSVKVYDGLEFLPWALNTKAEVGGSGLGTGGSKLPGIEMAELWVNPDAPIAPATTNYFDGYFTQDKPLDDTLTRFHMETNFMLPTQADVDACQCLEMEARQVLTGGLMFVWAVQLYFGGNKFRYWGYPTESGLTPARVPSSFPASSITSKWLDTVTRRMSTTITSPSTERRLT
jgi:hypothetical protein